MIWVVGLLSGVLLLFLVANLFPALFDRHCPNCGLRTFTLAGSAKYSRADQTGNRGGGYTIYRCEECGTCELHWRGEPRPLPSEGYVEAAHVIVFGEPINDGTQAPDEEV